MEINHPLQMIQSTCLRQLDRFAENAEDEKFLSGLATLVDRFADNAEVGKYDFSGFCECEIANRKQFFY
ncbi:MAG: hypothetical protein IPN29_05730 [Saprospiraceae bacterium]|nr:hypothetical protein [Saprospiraceae bacterium]